MPITKKTWIVLIASAVLSFFLWVKLTLPELAFINLAVDRAQALRIAKDYLGVQRGIDYSAHQSAVVFTFDNSTNRYLQKTIGPLRLASFIQQERLHLFYWTARFFKKNEKEEYQVDVSCGTGEVVGFRHTVSESAARPKKEREASKAMAIAFLKRHYGFDPEQYTLMGDLLRGYDNRDEYRFIWEKTGVQIPWRGPGDGLGKIALTVTVSGEEILKFGINAFWVPDEFSRDLSRQMNVGKDLMSLVSVFQLLLLTASIYYVAARPNHLAMHATKKFYLSLVGLSIALSIAGFFNRWETLLFGYSTTDPFESYLWRLGLATLQGALFLSIAIIMPALSGELLYNDVDRDKRAGSFLYYLRTTFFSRGVGNQIVAGYFVAVIILGGQSFLTKIGQDHWGVWVEHNWMENLSSNYWPFLVALTFGFKTSFSEELMYRLFAINWARKIFKNIPAAVIVTSLIWGFMHSGYPVFPMWFRGIEMSILGVLMAVIYLKMGIIPVLVGHYLFNVFWHTIGYLVGSSGPFYYLNSIAVLFLPLGLSLVCFIVNKQVELRPLRWHLNKHQEFNLEVLKTYLRLNRAQFAGHSREEMIREITRHGWDTAVVETALEEGEGGVWKEG